MNELLLVTFENETTLYTIFALSRLLRNRREQRPSNQDDPDSGVIREVCRVYCTGDGPHLIEFVYHIKWLFLCCVLNGTYV